MCQKVDAPARLAGGQILGWAALGILNVVMVAVRLPLPPGGLAVRALHYVYEAGQMLAAGLLSAAIVEAWQRWGPRGRSPAIVALAVLSVVLGAFFLPEDVSVAAAKIPGPFLLWQIVLVGAFALTIPIAALVTTAIVERPDPPDTSWMARRGAPGLARRLPPNPGLRGFAILSGLGLSVVNRFVLVGDYPGVHLYCTWAAALVIGIAASIELPRLLPRRVGLVLRAALAVLAAFTVAVRPQNRVAIELRKASDSSLAPWILRAHLLKTGHLASGSGEWFVDRSTRPAVPPSSPSPLPKGAIVFLITIDALRADVIADPRNEALLPSFAALRREAVNFSEARSTATGTSASLASLFSGRYFSQLQWTQKPGTLVCPYTDLSTRFPDLLASAGVATVTFAGMPGLLNSYGIARGFQEETFIRGRPWATAKMVIDPLLTRLGAQGPGPLFLYVHLTDAHMPYDLAGTQGTDFERYLREVALVDAQIGRIRRALTDLHIEDRTALIVSADHGEAFGEHNTHSHATTVYDELLRVPLLVRVPGLSPRVVEAPVSLIDLAPTVLDLMGVSTPGIFMGQSLVPYLRGEDPTLTRPLVAESSRGLRAMLFPDHRKVIHDQRAGTHELYNLAVDPGERVDLADTDSAVAEERLEILSSFFRVHELRLPGYKTPYVR